MVGTQSPLPAFLLLLLLPCIPAETELKDVCTNSWDFMSCSSEEKCIEMEYVCDGEKDCVGGEDEDTDLCFEYKNFFCGPKKVACRHNGELECMELREYCEFNKPPCEGIVDPRICKMLEVNVIQRFSDMAMPGRPNPTWRQSEALGEDLVANINNTLSHPDCPEMFTMVGEQCLSFFFVGKVSWGESRAFCRMLGGDLLTIENVEHFTTVLQHLQTYQLTSDFWIGGHQREKGRGWAWLDDTPMAMGSPYWAVRRYDDCQVRNVTTASHSIRPANGTACYHYRQAPEPDQKGYCAALSYQHYFYITDEDCMCQKSPLCVTRTGFYAQQG